MTKRNIKDCKAGIASAQKLLYKFYVDRLFNVSVRYCRDTHEAKDVLQDSFVKVFQKIINFDGDLVQLESWMVKIVINTALQNYRKQKRTFYTEDKSFVFEEAIPPSILNKLEYEEFKIIISKLPTDLRITFNLSFVEGYKHKEIASLLGIKESSSRTRLTRAKKLLRELIINAKIVKYAH